MAKPRVFISSTYYDLRHIRTSLDAFAESMGFEPVLSEKGNIAYSPDVPLDESCYREVATCDFFVLIIGGRYGSERSGSASPSTRTFFDRYESITRQEYQRAIELDIPTYILVDRDVYSEHGTYRRNRGNSEVSYAHVDSINIFGLIDDILLKPRNNPVHTFEKFYDIEHWLRDQWSGLFRELLRRMSNQRQIASLATQVAELQEINKTLKTYLEAIVTTVAPDQSASLIETEEKRLELAKYPIDVLDIEGHKEAVLRTIDELREAGFTARLYVGTNFEKRPDKVDTIATGTLVPVELAAKVLEVAFRNFPFMRFVRFTNPRGQHGFAETEMTIGALTSITVKELVRPATKSEIKLLTNPRQSQDQFIQLIESFYEQPPGTGREVD